MLRTIAALVVWNAFATLAVAGAAWLTKIPLAIVGESVLVAELGIVAAVIVGAIVRRVKRGRVAPLRLRPDFDGLPYAAAFDQERGLRLRQ